MSVLNRETFFRVLSALVALPVLFYIFITDDFLSTPILIGSIVISLASLYEFYMIVDRGDDGSPFVKTGLLFGLIFNIAIYLLGFGKLYGLGRFAGGGGNFILSILFLMVVVVMVLQLSSRSLKGASYSVAVTVLGVVFIVLFASHLILLKSLKDGVFYIMTLIVVVMLNDSGAYFGGLLLGKHKVGFELSPNKSWEGYFSGLFFGILGFILANQVALSFFGRELFTMMEAVLLGIFLCFLADLGDLVESLIKRDGGIKDSGSIIPGHGGMWDVFDAIIFTLPFFYYYIVFRGLL